LENQKETDNKEDLDIGGRTIVKWILDRMGGIYRINLGKDRDQWRALVNTVMNRRAP
jgi:hypothetical protein